MADEALQARYTETPYRLGATFQSHPARLAAVARLLGRATPALRGARVLELGCASGLNLLPLAAAFPETQFTGVDLVAPSIAEGRELIAATGLTNIRLEQADLRTFVPEAQSFDYVIAHGVFSWVEDDVKAALLACCARAVKPNGLVYISYNTYPGWKPREALRDLLQLRLRGVESAADRRTTAQATLNFLHLALEGRKTPQALAMRALVQDMTEKDPTVFYHDELEGTNDPCYLLQFVEWAGDHGLHYLGDAQFSSMLPDNFSPEAGAGLSQLAPDQLQSEQLMDYVRQRTFRSTLLCRSDVEPKLELQPDTLRDCAFGSMLRAGVAVPDLRDGVRTRFADGSKFSLYTEKAGVKAMLCVLAAEWPRRVPFAEAVAATRKLLAHAGIAVPADLEALLVQCLLDLCGRGAVDFLLACGLDCATRLPSAPRVDALTRATAERGLPMSNSWHETYQFDAATRKLLAALDGSRQIFDAKEQAILRTVMAAGFLQAEK